MFHGMELIDMHWIIALSQLQLTRLITGTRTAPSVSHCIIEQPIPNCWHHRPHEISVLICSRRHSRLYQAVVYTYLGTESHHYTTISWFSSTDDKYERRHHGVITRVLVKVIRQPKRLLKFLSIDWLRSVSDCIDLFWIRACIIVTEAAPKRWYNLLYISVRTS